MASNSPTTKFRPHRLTVILTDAERAALTRLAEDARMEGNLSRSVGWALRVAELVIDSDPSGYVDPAAALAAWARGQGQSEG